MKVIQRIRRSDAQWAELLEQFDASGLSAATFCRQHGICYATFANRRRRAVAKQNEPKASSAATDWLPIDLAGDGNRRARVTSPATTTTEWDIELTLPGGVQLRMQAR